MTMSSRLVKFGWFISIFVFFLALLYVYAYLPSSVSIYADARGMADMHIDREYFFYLLLGFFGLANIAFYSLSKLIHLQYLPNVNLNDQLRKRTLKEDLADWLLGLAAALNIFLVLGMIFLGVFNNSEGITFSHYGLVVYAGPVLIGLMLLLLIFIFFKKRD